MTPEEKARGQIDAILHASGWAVQSKDEINLSAGRGVTISELSFTTGEPDYTLFVDGKAIGTVEAKPQGTAFTSAEADLGEGSRSCHSTSLNHGLRKDGILNCSPCRANADCGRSGIADESCSGAGVGGVGQPATGVPAAAIHPPKSLHRRTRG